MRETKTRRLIGGLAAVVFVATLPALPAEAVPKAAIHPHQAARVRTVSSHARRDMCDVYRLIGLHYQAQAATGPWGDPR